MKIDITELNVVDLKPGQVLVATLKTRLDNEQSDLILQWLKETFPNNKIMLKTNELTFEVIDGQAQD